MDVFMKLSRHTQTIMVGLVLYVILSFFDRQQASVPSFSSGGLTVGGGTYGWSEWHGFMGVLTVLVAIVWLVWELATRIGGVKVSAGGVTNEFTSAGIAIVFLVFTIILFFVKNEARHWPAYVGTLIAIGVSIVGIMRAKEEGVTVDHAKAHMETAKAAVGGMASSGGSSTAPPPSSAPPESTPPPPSSPTMGDAVDEPGPGEGESPSSTI